MLTLVNTTEPIFLDFVKVRAGDNDARHKKYEGYIFDFCEKKKAQKAEEEQKAEDAKMAEKEKGDANGRDEAETQK